MIETIIKFLDPSFETSEERLKRVEWEQANPPLWATYRKRVPNRGCVSEIQLYSYQCDDNRFIRSAKVIKRTIWDDGRITTEVVEEGWERCSWCRSEATMPYITGWEKWCWKKGFQKVEAD